MNIKFEGYKALKDGKQNRRRFLSKIVQCTVLIPPVINQLVIPKTSHAALPPKGLNNTKDKEFYDDVLKLAQERFRRYT